jgi:hypothetical protein
MLPTILSESDLKGHIDFLLHLRTKHNLTVPSRFPHNYLVKLKGDYKPKPGQPKIRFVTPEPDSNGALSGGRELIEQLITAGYYVDVHVFSDAEEAIEALQAPLIDTKGNPAPIGGLIIFGHGIGAGEGILCGYPDKVLKSGDLKALKVANGVYVKKFGVLVQSCRAGARGEDGFLDSLREALPEAGPIHGPEGTISGFDSLRVIPSDADDSIQFDPKWRDSSGIYQPPNRQTKIRRWVPTTLDELNLPELYNLSPEWQGSYS